MLDTALRTTVTASVNWQDFTRPNNQVLFRFLTERAGQARDVVALCSKLADDNELDQVGGKGRVSAIFALLPSTADADAHAATVAQCARRRRLRKHGAELAAACAGASDDAVEAQLKRLEAESKRSTRQCSIATYSAEALRDRVFHDPPFVVPGILPSGLTLLIGPPKIGKSWWALGIGVAVASGGIALGGIAVTKGAVLYLGLEDHQRRMQKRLRQMDPNGFPLDLHVAHAWPRLSDGCLEALDQHMAAFSDTRLIVVDTLNRIAPAHPTHGTKYDADSAALAPLQEWAVKRDISVLVVHHTRKGTSSDPLEMVNGSNGLTGVADTSLVFFRRRGQADAFMFVTGRDIDEKELAFAFDRTQGLWKLLGDAADHREASTKDRVLAYVDAAEGGVSPKDVADDLGIAIANVRQTLKRLADDGKVRHATRGTYESLSRCHDVTNDEEDERDNVTNVTDVAQEEEGDQSSVRDNVTNVTGVPDSDAPSGSAASPSHDDWAAWGIDEEVA